MYFCALFHWSRVYYCCCSSVVEHFLGKEEVVSSSLINSSRKASVAFRWHLFFVIYWVGLTTSKALLLKGGFGRIVDITLRVHKHPSVQAWSTAHEKQVSPLGDTCFFYYFKVCKTGNSKALLIKGGVGWIINTTLWVHQHTSVQAWSTTNKPSPICWV